ncbi:uncharacterized protein F5147DRAFT_783174 [Suillus discolor]|uniref:Uncharacterized protein n=1 Tax=Suillus discolor TaxID=1912936 RepID=A0A9P7JKN1_9AGAM|nr:uncharacterized protein F5147DRAFT_783174 [Suillus discolor]KAG2082780.1 hypothetical protein F5147DRAFT_783174 [Suillus discolor]
MMYPAGNASYSDFKHTVLGHSIDYDSENINSLFSDSHRQPEVHGATTSHHSSDSLSGRLDPSAPAAQIQLDSFDIQHHHISMQHPNQSPGQHDFLSSHSPLSSGPSWYPGAAAMQHAPMFAPFPTFGESHQGNDLPPPISYDHPLPGAAAMWQAPMFTRCHHWPSSSDHVPPPTLDNYNGTLLPPFIVPSQDPICLNDLASLPSALADYRRNFSPPLLSMDGVTMLPPAAPDYIQPQPLTALKHPHPQTQKRDDGLWRFVTCSGQRQKPFETPSSAPSSTTPSHPTPTQSMQPQIDLPPLDYQSNLPIHNAFILAAEKELISSAVNNCTMIKPSLREGLVQAALVNAVQSCLKITRSDPAELAKKEIEGKLNIRFGEWIAVNLTEFGQRWAEKNAGLLYMSLSAPFKILMAACKELAFSVVDRGYDLRPSLWSNTLESKWKQKKIKSLIGNATWPLKFLFKKDEETGQWMAFEHDTLLDVVLGVVRKLKYRHYIRDLDNLYCMAAAAIYCVLMQFSSRKLDREIEFSTETFKFIYDLSKQYIANVIQKNKKLAKRWSDVKARTMTRLADIV